MKSLPKFAADYLGEFPPVEARFQQLAAKQPILEAASEAAFAMDQQAAQQVKDLEGALSREEARDNAERDLRGEETLKRQLVSAREARAASEKLNKIAVARSHGTRLAFESVIRLVEGTLSGENAKLDIASVKLPKTIDLDFVYEQRAAIEAIDEQAALTVAAPPPSSDVLARALHDLEAVTRRGAIKVSAQGQLIMPQQLLNNARPIVGSEGVKADDAVALLASLFPDLMAAQVKSAVEARYRDIPPDVTLSGAQKKAKIAELVPARFDVELAEVAAVLRLWSEGHSDVGLRAETSPLAVLGVRSWKARPRRDAPLQWVETTRRQPQPQERVWVGEADAIASAR